MLPLLRHFLLFALVFALVPQAARGSAAERDPAPNGTAWDNAVTSLLAAGMYGFDADALDGLTVQLQHSDHFAPGLNPGKHQLGGQAITFSYEGSAGLLEFSAGYILSTQQNGTEPGTVFMSVDPGLNKDFDPGRSWFLALDLSRSYQIDDGLSFSLGNRVMLLNNPFNTEEGQIFSLLFNMPISYKDYLTITPEFHWSRPLSDAAGSNQATISGTDENQGSDGTFYGGVSIKFSY